MRLTLNLILFFIRDLCPVIVQRVKTGDSFIGVKQFFVEAWELEESQGDSNQNADQYLYIGNLSELYEQRERLSSKMTALVVENMELSEKEKQMLSCSLICVDEKYKVPYIMNRMIGIFSRISNWDKNMHIAALEGKTLQELLDISEEILGHPMIVFDASFSVLAYTKNISGSNRNFRETVEQGYTDVKTMERVKKKNIFPRLKNGKALVAPAAADDGQINVYLCFYSGQILLGYACIFHDKTRPDEGYLDLLKLFTENLNFCMKRDYENHRFGQMMYETFLVNLMNPAAVPKEQLQEQIKSIDNLPEAGRFVLGLLQFGDDVKEQLSYIGRMADREMWDVRPFIYEEYICLLKILKEDDEPIHDWEMKNMQELFVGYDFTFGLSNVFYQIWDLRYAFLQAKTALDFGKREKKTFCLYQDYYSYHLLSCMEQQMPLEHLQPEFYKQIKLYDEENKTQYQKMVLTYLECDCNATRAAQHLYLHRNTIHHAVNFVEERWKICISDTEIKKMFVLSDLIDKYLLKQI